jgi:hypothetical protein
MFKASLINHSAQLVKGMHLHVLASTKHFDVPRDQLVVEVA